MKIETICSRCKGDFEDGGLSTLGDDGKCENVCDDCLTQEEQDEIAKICRYLVYGEE